MISQPFLLLVTFAYILGLAGVALWAERHRPLQHRLHPYIYSLTLAVYCSSWTYFGAVGTAAVNAWEYVPIYAGPLLLFVLGRPVLRKLTRVGAFHKTTSIADFIGTRYGKRQLLAVAVSLVAVIGSMPYIALQLKAVSQAWNILAEAAPLGFGGDYKIDTALATALFLAGFAMLFGTRRIESRERNHGMMAALSVESLVKLVALVLIAVFGVALLLDAYRENPGVLSTLVSPWLENPLSDRFVTVFLLSVLAILCLPRQFHVTVVEFQDERDIQTAAWLFPLYLLLIILLVMPITVAGQYLYMGTGVQPDTYVLRLPMGSEYHYLTLLGFIGGFSAATGMAIVATVTLAIMISNEIILPMLLRWGKGQFSQAVFLGRYIRWIRRLCIVLLLLGAWLSYRLMVQFAGLASIGLISFACFAQLAPALLGAVYWQRAHAKGVYAGLAVGFLGWLYCLLLPVFFPADSSFLINGPWSINWLRPQSLFGLDFLDPLTHGVLWSLLPNLLIFVLVSRFAKASGKDSRQAVAFVRNLEKLSSEEENFELSTLQVRQLRMLLDSFLDLRLQQELWCKAEAKYKQRLLEDDRAPLFVVWEVENALSGVIGAASAQQAIALLDRSAPLEFRDIAAIVGGTSKQLQFNEDLLQVTIETVSQGISVVDAELRLVAWNQRYEELFEYPPRLLYVGCPIERVYEYNAQRGMYQEDSSPREQVAKRLQLLQKGGPHQFARTLPNGRTIQVIGNPMSSGGFVTTYMDISAYTAVVSELEESKATLEQRVRQRTEDLSRLNVELARENQLRSRAEKEIRAMHQSKSKFMQAASHDLLQPISAAKLFAAALQQAEMPPPAFKTQVGNIAQSLMTAEHLINALREIARLESGKLAPKLEDFSLGTIMQPLATEFAVLAEQKGLALRAVISNQVVHSDPHLVRRMLQNFLSNAIHYTRRGRILMGTRRRGSCLSLQIWDTGPGISNEGMARIFNEFERLNPGTTSTDKGLGLGLTIAQRMAGLLDCEIRVRSSLGQGSMFSFELPVCGVRQVQRIDAQAMPSKDRLQGLRVLCVDNEEQILHGMQSLLAQWGCEVLTARNTLELDTLFEQPPPDILLLDFHLREDLNGLRLIGALPAHWRARPAIIISADISDATRQQVLAAGFDFMAKPVQPEQLAERITALVSRD